MKICYAPLLLALLLTAETVYGSLTITSETRIVPRNLNGSAEQAAVKLLQEHLKAVFRKEVKVVQPKTLAPGKTAIILTRSPEMKPEEWHIAVRGNQVHITGGFPRGVFYGACEFLERFAGVRWFTAWETKIPRANALKVPAGELKGAPAFPVQRYVYDTVDHRRNMLFHARNRATRFSAMAPDRKRFSEFGNHGLGQGHTFYLLTKALPKNMEHCLPVNAAGRRIRSTNPNGPAQLCFSNQEFRRFAKKEIAKWIDAHKQRIKKAKTKNDKIAFIDLSLNDNRSYCQCAGCKKLYKKYGAISGALLEFINDIASAYPEHIFQTFAYGDCLKPPTGIKARSNVMVQFAFLSQGKKRTDLLRPITSPTNATVREYYAKWQNVVDKKAVWAYQRVFPMTEMFPWPQCCWWYLAEDIRYYHRMGIQKYFAESEYRGSPRAFHDLHIYLTFCVLNDPGCNVEEKVKEFFDFQYGPAAPVMREYADYLKKRLDGVKGTLNDIPIPARSCFDVEFFTKISGLLTKAEKLAGNDKKLLARIQIERIPLDMAALYMWDKYGKKAFGSREKVVARLKKCTKVMINRYFPRNRRVEKHEATRLLYLSNPIPVPPGMENLHIIQTPALAGVPKLQVNDPDALYGKAMKCPPVVEKYAHHKHHLRFGIYDQTTKRSILGKVFRPEELKQDEKYHLYYLGRAVPNVHHRISLWGHVTWRLRLDELLRPALDITDPDRPMDIYISLKVTGPAYVKNSKKEDAVYVDKVICVKLDK